MSEDQNTTGMQIPRPFEQLPRLARETTADNPWPVSVLSQKFHTAVEKWPAAW
ncbi:MAG: exodeoxyribonuclease VII large subunit, partial [Bifidobacterium merycicum]|nr:exodeoxyribonuclease VII large subunit [Bifidobacterium merycicum]